MRGFFKIKTLLLWMLIASPAVGVWIDRAPGKSPENQEIQSAAVTSGAGEKPSVVRVPIEIIAKGSAPQWIYVEVGSQAIPEPSVSLLVVLTGVLLAFRRQRE